MGRMMTRLRLARQVALCVVLSAGATVASAQPVVREGRLVTPAGLALYTFANDVPGSGRSVCLAPCSNIFPPYLVEAGAAATGELSIIERPDGTKQWAHKGRPLYRWFDDREPADRGGDGMNRGVWQLAAP